VQELELTTNEQLMLNGEMGEGKRKAMEILVALGKIYGAKKMIPITSAQIAGVSYKTIGDAGLGYLKHMAALGAKVEIPSFLNPAGMDIEQWESLGIPRDFALKQMEILDAYSTMGITMSCTCTPYLIGIKPKVGEHIAWSESSAISFANSVLGAKTNREGGPSALCAAICGVTPYYGLHLDENRVANLIVKVDAKLTNRTDFGLLGLIVGKKSNGRIPAFKTFPGARPNENDLKYLGAAMAASGSVPIYFVEKFTPEWRVAPKAEEITITQADLDKAKKALNEVDTADIITLGCPHASLSELTEIAGLLERKPVKKTLWICVARQIKIKAQEMGIAQKIEKNGGKLVADTCMVVAPLERMGFKRTAVDSGKAAVYLPTMCQQKLLFGKIEEILWK
jgi:predicted aconitase